VKNDVVFNGEKLLPTKKARLENGSAEQQGFNASSNSPPICVENIAHRTADRIAAGDRASYDRQYERN
jgi:hypothetical protein